MQRFVYLRQQPENPEETDIEKLDVSGPTIECLKNCGIWTIEELLGVSEMELRNIKQVGDARVKEIKDGVEKFLAKRKNAERVFPRNPNRTDPLRTDDAGFLKSGKSIFEHQALKRQVSQLGLNRQVVELFEESGIREIGQLLVLTEDEICSIGPKIKAQYLGLLSRMRIFLINNGINCSFPAEPIIVNFEIEDF